MRFSLLPRAEKFFDLLEEHAKGVQKGTALFVEIIQNWTASHDDIARMKELEHESDSTTHEIMDALNRTFITPIDREDIYRLAKQLDDVVDIAYRIVVRLELFGIKKTTQELCELGAILNEAAQVVYKGVASIRHLNRPGRILDYCIEINRLENAGDRACERAISHLFQEQKDPFEVIKWKELYDTVENGIDTCEDIANTLETIVVKYG
jgi:predicted phosphate transport protein (TIGR00153 family)